MITVLGSINLDLTGRVARLPAAGETVPGSDFARAAGGKGANQALAAKRAGAQVKLFGAVGADEFAPPALDLLKGDGVDLVGVRTVESATGIAMILVDGKGENMIAVLQGANGVLNASDAEAALAGLGRGAILMLQQEIGQEATERALDLAHKNNVLTLFNTAPFLEETPALARKANIVIANETEFALLAGKGALEAKMGDWAKANSRTIVVTLGAEGARAATPERFINVAAYPVTPVDTVGAGDTFCGYLAAGLDAGLDLEAAMRRAAVAGALACLKPGAQPAIPYAGEVDAASKGSR